MRMTLCSFLLVAFFTGCASLKKEATVDSDGFVEVSDEASINQCENEVVVCRVADMATSIASAYICPFMGRIDSFHLKVEMDVKLR